MPGPDDRVTFSLRIEGLSLERDDVSILHDVTWAVRAGEHWAVIGPNGSGKTSLFSAILGYLPATTGSIEVLGGRYGEADWREMRRRIGIVSSALPPLMSPIEPALKTVLSGKSAMLGYWGEVDPTDRERAEILLARIECEHLAERPFRVLSQGERQRVLIGRALMGEPALLILDEPCAGLDPAARETFLEFLGRLAKDPRAPSFLLVTHHIEEIVEAFSHVLVLRRGTVLRRGPKDEVLCSEVVSAAFDRQATVIREGQRYRLAVEAKVDAIV